MYNNIITIPKINNTAQTIRRHNLACFCFASDEITGKHTTIPPMAYDKRYDNKVLFVISISIYANKGLIIPIRSISAILIKSTYHFFFIKLHIFHINLPSNQNYVHLSAAKNNHLQNTLFRDNHCLAHTDQKYRDIYFLLCPLAII